MTDASQSNCSAATEGLAERLRQHVVEDHVRGCMGRQYGCTCGYNVGTDSLLEEAAGEIERLHQLETLHFEETKRSNALEAECDRLRALLPDDAQPTQLPDNWDRLSFELAGDIQHSGMGREEAAGRIRAFACDTMLTALAAQPPAVPVEPEAWTRQKVENYFHDWQFWDTVAPDTQSHVIDDITRMVRGNPAAPVEPVACPWCGFEGGRHHPWCRSPALPALPHNTVLQPPAAPVETKPDWCQGADAVCHHPACACVVETGPVTVNEYEGSMYELVREQAGEMRAAIQRGCDAVNQDLAQARCSAGNAKAGCTCPFDGCDPCPSCARAATDSAAWDQPALDLVNQIWAIPADWHPKRRKAHAQVLIIDAMKAHHTSTEPQAAPVLNVKSICGSTKDRRVIEVWLAEPATRADRDALTAALSRPEHS